MAKADKGSLTRIRFETRVISWRGPSPFVFAPIPVEHAERFRLMSKAVTYGWGMIPVEATIKTVAFKTSLFPKDATYLLPIKTDVRRRANIRVGDLIDVAVAIQQDRL